MKEYTGDRDSASGTEMHGDQEFDFKLYCDICGRKDQDDEIPVQRLTEDEGFPEGDYCEECRRAMEEEGLVGEDLTPRTPEEGSPEENRTRLHNVLKIAKHTIREKALDLDGFWTYDNEFFSVDYVSWLIEEDLIILNEDMGETPTLDLRSMELDEAELENRASNAIQQIMPWYHLDRGRLFRKGKAAKAKVRRYLRSFSRTLSILDQDIDDGYLIHADNAGTYLLELLALSGGSHHETVFTIDGLRELRDFVEEKRPRGAMITLVTTDAHCPLQDLDLSALMELFDIDEMHYLKLLTVTEGGRLAENIRHRNGRGEVYAILAYSL